MRDNKKIGEGRRERLQSVALSLPTLTEYLIDALKNNDNDWIQESGSEGKAFDLLYSLLLLHRYDFLIYPCSLAFMVQTVLLPVFSRFQIKLNLNVVMIFWFPILSVVKFLGKRLIARNALIQEFCNTGCTRRDWDHLFLRGYMARQVKQRSARSPSPSASSVSAVHRCTHPFPSPFLRWIHPNHPRVGACAGQGRAGAARRGTAGIARAACPTDWLTDRSTSWLTVCCCCRSMQWLHSLKNR